MLYFEGASTSEELSFYLSTDYEFKACRLITKCMGACVTTYIFTCMFVCVCVRSLHSRKKEREREIERGRTYLCSRAFE